MLKQTGNQHLVVMTALRWKLHRVFEERANERTRSPVQGLAWDVLCKGWMTLVCCMTLERAVL